MRKFIVSIAVVACIFVTNLAHAQQQDTSYNKVFNLIFSICVKGAVPLSSWSKPGVPVFAFKTGYTQFMVFNHETDTSLDRVCAIRPQEATYILERNGKMYSVEIPGEVRITDTTIASLLLEKMHLWIGGRE